MQTQKLYYTKYFCPQTLQIMIAADFAGIKLELNEINKKYDSINLVTKQGVLNKTNAILHYLSAGTALNGSTTHQRNQLNTWYEYFNTQILPVITQLYAQIFGQKPANQTKYTYCITEIMKSLKVLDDCLKIKTFFVGNNITIFDITLACYLDSLFKLVVTEAERKKLNNLARWFAYVRAIPIFAKYQGNLFLCGKDAFKIDFSTNSNKTEQTTKTETKTEVKPEAKTQTKKEPKKSETKTQTKAQKVQEKPAAKTQATQTAQKPNEFKLDDFKREFQNSQNQSEVLTNLLNTLNQQKFSIWKIHYDKDESEGKVLYLTQNLANGSLQRIENIRKVGFGTWGVYGEEGNYEVRGVMIWEGTQIHPVWKEHPAFEYHKFTKLSPNNEEDRKLIVDYIIERETAEGLTLRSAKRIV